MEEKPKEKGRMEIDSKYEPEQNGVRLIEKKFKYSM